MINKNSSIKIDVDLSNFDPEGETGNSLDENFEMIVAAAPKYKVRVSSVMSDPEEDNYTFEASGKAGDLFSWWKDWFKICGADVVYDDIVTFGQFKEFFFLDEDETDLEAATKPRDMDALISDEYDLEEDEEEDDEDDSEGMEWEAGELESEAGSVVIQAILELIDNQIEVLGYHFDEWMEEKKEEGYTNEDEMHDAIEWAYTRTRQAIENLSIQD